MLDSLVCVDRSRVVGWSSCDIIRSSFQRYTYSGSYYVTYFVQKLVFPRANFRLSDKMLKNSIINRQRSFIRMMTSNNAKMDAKVVYHDGKRYVLLQKSLAKQCFKCLNQLTLPMVALRGFLLLFYSLTIIYIVVCPKISMPHNS